jgi:hypothetical protein
MMQQDRQERRLTAFPLAGQQCHMTASQVAGPNPLGPLMFDGMQIASKYRYRAGNGIVNE